jgi:vacuolar-type H+-ATPase subunit H
MTSVIEDTLKALVEFESELDAAKAGASEARRRMVKDAGDWAAQAKAGAVAKAREIASQRLENARAEAEAEAQTIRKKGEASVKSFEASISKRKSKAAEVVVAKLLGAEP